MSFYISALGISLSLTLALESGYALLCRRRGKELLLIALMNLLTNPPTVLAALLQGKAWAGYIPLEAAVVVVEWLILKRFAGGIRNPFLLALGLNMFSFGAGLILTALI